MKVNTDGVLLAAWSIKQVKERQIQSPQKILDVGTGTGVIALMLAQEIDFTRIDAIDIELGAFQQAKENFSTSPWSNRLNAFHYTFQAFNASTLYDLIISNPPYFISDLQTKKHKRNVARHGILLNYEDLVEGIERFLEDGGCAFLIIPFSNFEILRKVLTKRELYVTATCEVVSVKGKRPYVIMVQIEKREKTELFNHVEIKDETGAFTNEYRLLTAAFYLDF